MSFTPNKTAGVGLVKVLLYLSDLSTYPWYPYQIRKAIRHACPNITKDELEGWTVVFRDFLNRNTLEFPEGIFEADRWNDSITFTDLAVDDSKERSKERERKELQRQREEIERQREEIERQREEIKLERARLEREKAQSQVFSRSDFGPFVGLPSSFPALPLAPVSSICLKPAQRPAPQAPPRSAFDFSPIGSNDDDFGFFSENGAPNGYV
jgi:DNA-binding PadR family transcriptional regulator